MGNVFRGGGDALSLSNGGTDVFVDVLTLAVSDLARDAWDYRFAALLTLQDQNVMGRGAVGFDLEEFDWGATGAERARAKRFVVRAVELALRRHRWEELGYEPPYAEGYLRQFKAMVEAYDPEANDPEAYDPEAYDPEAHALEAHDPEAHDPEAPDPAAGPAVRHAGLFPGADEAAVASCVRHRVLSALPFWEGCRFCTAG
ncbi:hypothetical protein ABT174_34075 [Streptomyces sparsogenes]|uniref:hypothetical protein n=1 Tax=Streptomyces sparsogenes TaxID=67365 RepID=UPI00331E968B